MPPNPPGPPICPCTGDMTLRDWLVVAMISCSHETLRKLFFATGGGLDGTHQSSRDRADHQGAGRPVLPVG